MLTADQRQQAVARLDQLADELGQIATWLSRSDEDQAAILIEEAWRDMMAASHVLTRRQRTRPPGWLSGEPYALYGPQRNGSSAS
jgi:hypothetical protein